MDSLQKEINVIYQCYYKDVYRFCYQLCGQNVHLAEELTQNTFYKAILSADSFKGNCENGEVNFYLGEQGIRSLGPARSWVITPKYQRLIDPSVMPKVKTVNYCKPDGTVILTLWKTGDDIEQLK